MVRNIKKLIPTKKLSGNQIAEILLKEEEYSKRYIENVWTELYNRLYSSVGFNTKVFEGDYHKAEDVFQTAFIDLIYAKYKTHYKKGNFIGWCRRVINMKMLEVKRLKSSRDNRYHIPIVPNLNAQQSEDKTPFSKLESMIMKCVIHDEYEVDFDETPQVEQKDKAIQLALKKLSPIHFGIFELRYNQKKTPSEICVELNIDKNEYNKRMNGMKRELKKYFGIKQKPKNIKIFI